jgi:arsenate reductase
MAEVDLDISGQRSKHLNEYLDTQFDYIITLCDRARGSCPDFPRDNETLHWHLNDPTEAKGSDAEKLVVFRRVRDELQLNLERWIAASSAPKAA